ncbi:MAG: hypothetical protein MI674_03530 [Cytophagales bacterium]|nr:hypothetical protein [Cytophagales bacterium]
MVYPLIVKYGARGGLSSNFLTGKGVFSTVPYRNQELRTQNSELRTRNSELGTQNSELRTQNSELGTKKIELSNVIQDRLNKQTYG